jgi:hypothetical protein
MGKNATQENNEIDFPSVAIADDYTGTNHLPAIVDGQIQKIGSFSTPKPQLGLKYSLI